MKLPNRRSESGKSLTETLTVLVIAAIIVTFAISQFGQSKDKFQRQNVAREFKVDLERARFDSIKRHATDTTTMAFVKLNSANSFSVATDMNQNGLIDAGEIRKLNFTNNNIKIVGNALAYPITIFFDKRGFTTVTDSTGAAVNPVFTICDNCTLATATSKNSSVVSISTTGTVLMTPGGQSVAAFPTPSITSVGGSSQISSLVVVTPSPTP